LAKSVPKPGPRAGSAAFVRQGIGQPSVWDGLRHQVFLGSEPFVEQPCGAATPERLRQVPRAQRRPLAKPLADFARRYPDRGEAMARALQTGVYSMQEIADAFGVHYSTVSRAVRRPEGAKGPRAANRSEPGMLDLKTPSR